jgi:NTP pyrophosphatase (non-canonical NTP hydrolase)
MNNINDFIKSLSIKDKKTLSQKGLKLVEEVGELARVILPYDSAHGTNHRFIDREAILEEVVDVYLTNISIVHSLGFTDEEFNDMLVKKSEKWSKLQISEEKAEFPLPFEIHVTVDATKTFNSTMFDGDEEDLPLIDIFDIDKFKDACSKIEVKPIVIDLEINDGSILKDVMTSSKHFGDNRSAYEESERIANELSRYGFKVVRKKIETVPWHPAAPTYYTGEEIPNGCYFESHIGVIITPERKEDLQEFVEGLNQNCTAAGRVELGGTAKLSRNFFKKTEDGKFVNMITYRNNMTSNKEFQDEVKQIENSLKHWANNFEYEKVEVEYAVYDTNVTHDAKWILGYEVA